MQTFKPYIHLLTRFPYATNWHDLLNKQLLRLSHCDLCKGHVTRFHLLCDVCHQDLPQFNFHSIAFNLLNWPSMHAKISHQHFNTLYALSPYLWPFDYWIKRLKYSQKFEYAQLLAQLLAFEWTTRTSAMLPINTNVLCTSVAMHPKRWGKRGYNQSHLIAKQFCRLTALPYSSKLVRRVHQQASQVGQSGAKRRRQLHGAFKIEKLPNPLPETVLIIDDVVTTGSTVNEMARILKRAGIKYIVVIAIAVALPQ